VSLFECVWVPPIYNEGPCLRYYKKLKSRKRYGHGLTPPRRVNAINFYFSCPRMSGWQSGSSERGGLREKDIIDLIPENRDLFFLGESLRRLDRSSTNCLRLATSLASLFAALASLFAALFSFSRVVTRAWRAATLSSATVAATFAATALASTQPAAVTAVVSFSRVVTRAWRAANCARIDSNSSVTSSKSSSSFSSSGKPNRADLAGCLGTTVRGASGSLDATPNSPKSPKSSTAAEYWEGWTGTPASSPLNPSSTRASSCVRNPLGNPSSARSSSWYVSGPCFLGTTRTWTGQMPRIAVSRCVTVLNVYGFPQSKPRPRPLRIVKI
jgi:hypothetical protein